MRLDELLLEYRIHNEPTLDSFILQLIQKVNNNHTNYDNIVNWLNKKVKKELANNDQYSHPLSPTDISQLSNEFDVKDASNGTLRKFKPTDELKDKLNHIIDWLNSEGMSSYNPMGIKDIDSAYTMAEDFFQQKQIKMEKELEKRKKNPKYNYSDEMGKIKPIMEFNDGYSIVQLLTPQSLDYESCNMGHCPHTVGGNFSCSNNNLTTLEGSPHTVGGNFYCYNNNLTTLEHCPHTFGGSFYCDDNQLTTLEHSPQTVGRDFDCSYNKLTTLEHCPQTVGGYFRCQYNAVNLERPKNIKIGGDFVN